MSVKEIEETTTNNKPAETEMSCLLVVALTTLIVALAQCATVIITAYIIWGSG